MKEKPIPTKIKTEFICEENASSFGSILERYIDALQKNGGEIINVSHGAGVGRGECDFGSSIKYIYSAIITYKVKCNE